MTDGAESIRLNEQTRNLLIELVKTRPILYIDNGEKSIADLRDERQKLWDEVSEEIGIPAEVCKTKFTNLKNNYFKNLRSDSVGPEMRRRLDFLDELAPWNRTQNERPARITSRRSTKRVRVDYNEDSDDPILVNTATTSVPQDSSGLLAVAGNGISDGHYDIHSPKFLHFANSTMVATGCDEQLQNGANGAAVNGSDEKRSTPQRSVPKANGGETDDLTSFFQSMEHTARKFNARLQIKVKRMISDIIYDAEEQWLNTMDQQA